MGYGKFREEAAQVPKKGADEKIDGVINEDKLGLDGIYVQAKRQQQTVGRADNALVQIVAGQQLMLAEPAADVPEAGHAAGGQTPCPRGCG